MAEAVLEDELKPETKVYVACPNLWNTLYQSCDVTFDNNIISTICSQFSIFVKELQPTLATQQTNMIINLNNDTQHLH